MEKMGCKTASQYKEIITSMQLVEVNDPGYNGDYLDFCPVMTKVSQTSNQNMQKLCCTFQMLLRGCALV